METETTVIADEQLDRAVRKQHAQGVIIRTLRDLPVDERVEVLEATALLLGADQRVSGLLALVRGRKRPAEGNGDAD